MQTALVTGGNPWRTEDSSPFFQPFFLFQKDTKPIRGTDSPPSLSSFPNISNKQRHNQDRRETLKFVSSFKSFPGLPMDTIPGDS